MNRVFGVLCNGKCAMQSHVYFMYQVSMHVCNHRKEVSNALRNAQCNPMCIVRTKFNVVRAIIKFNPSVLLSYLARCHGTHHLNRGKCAMQYSVHVPSLWQRVCEVDAFYSRSANNPFTLPIAPPLSS